MERGCDQQGLVLFQLEWRSSMLRQTTVTAPGRTHYSHYSENYFEWQKSGGKFGGRVELFKFKEFIKPTDSVIDFGCGGGFLLSELVCKDRIGVEVNPHARESCRELGIRVVEDLTQVKEEWANVVISNHALEHVYDPFEQIRQVRDKLKPGGMAVFVVPCERHDVLFKEDDINQHLYTWSPMNLGNLFASAGFRILECRELVHRWPPKWYLVAAWLGLGAFHVLSRIYGTAARRYSQVRVVAVKP